MAELVCGAYIVKKGTLRALFGNILDSELPRKASLLTKNRINRYVEHAVGLYMLKEVTQPIFFNI